VVEVCHSITAALEHFQLIVEAFDEAAGMATGEIIRDFLEMVIAELGGQRGAWGSPLAAPDQ
jgi:hypothetical protein